MFLLAGEIAIAAGAQVTRRHDPRGAVLLCEIVQRVGGYDGHGEGNAPVFLAAQERAEQLG